MDNPADPHAVSEELRRRVEERRRAQEFPEELKQDLSRHYRRIVEHRTKLGLYPLPSLNSHFDALHRHIQEIEAALNFDVKKISTSSEVAGGRAFHSAVNRVVGRQIGGVFDQVAGFANKTLDMLRTLQETVSILEEHVRKNTDLKIDIIWEWFTELESPPSANLETRHLAARIAQIERKVGPLGQLQNVNDLRRLRGYPGPDRLREISAKLKAASPPLIDLGAGVADLMEALLKAGVDVRGCDPIPTAAEQASAKGLEVKFSDPLDFLESNVDGALGGVAAIGIVERLTSSEFQEFGRLLSVKLRRGGVLVLGAIRPESIEEWTFAMSNDPGYVRPVASGLLKEMLQATGFGSFEEWQDQGTYQVFATR